MCIVMSVSVWSATVRPIQGLPYPPAWLPERWSGLRWAPSPSPGTCPPRGSVAGYPPHLQVNTGWMKQHLDGHSLTPRLIHRQQGKDGIYINTGNGSQQDLRLSEMSLLPGIDDVTHHSQLTASSQLAKIKKRIYFYYYFMIIGDDGHSK